MKTLNYIVLTLPVINRMPITPNSPDFKFDNEPIYASSYFYQNYVLEADLLNMLEKSVLFHCLKEKWFNGL